LDQASGSWEGDFRVTLDFVIEPLTKNAPLLTADSCMQNASNNGRIKVRGLPD